MIQALTQSLQSGEVRYKDTNSNFCQKKCFFFLEFSDTHNHTPDVPLWPGIEVQLLQVQDPRIPATGNPAFLNVSRKIFPETVDFTVTFPTFIEFVVTNSYAPVNKTKTIPDNIASKLEFFASLTKDKASSRYFISKSFFVKQPYNAENFEEAQKFLLEIPNDSCGIYINSEQGAISQRSANESAYVHRDALFNFKVFIDATDADHDHVVSGEMWMKQFLESVKFLDSGNTYQNYPERDVTEYLDRYYGSNLARLIEIKRKWDPNGYLKSPMSIPID